MRLVAVTFVLVIFRTAAAAPTPVKARSQSDILGINQEPPISAQSVRSPRLPLEPPYVFIGSNAWKDACKKLGNELERQGEAPADHDQVVSARDISLADDSLYVQLGGDALRDSCKKLASELQRRDERHSDEDRDRHIKETDEQRYVEPHEAPSIGGVNDTMDQEESLAQKRNMVDVDERFKRLHHEIEMSVQWLIEEARKDEEEARKLDEETRNFQHEV